MNAGEWFGLVLMITAFVITGAVLTYDGYRVWVQHTPSISWLQWEALRAWWAGRGVFPPLVLLLPAGVGLQSFGLFIHFLAGLLKGGVQ